MTFTISHSPEPVWKRPVVNRLSSGECALVSVFLLEEVQYSFENLNIMKETEEFHQLREVTVICYGNQVNCTLKSKTHLKFRMFLFKFISVNNRAGDGILNDPTGQQEHWLGADTGDMLYRAFKQLHVFPSFLTVSCFPRFVTATCFPALSNILVFPTFSDSHMFSRAFRR